MGKFIRSRRENPSLGWGMFAGFLGAAALLGTAYGAGWLDTSPAPPAVASAGEPKSVSGTFGFCPVGAGTNCVVDGDTFWVDGENVRIADIDAPETHEPRCSAEKSLGDRATRRLHELVNSGTVTLEGIGRDSDSYGRKLRVVLVDGTSVGDTLVDEGLARWYQAGRRSWC